MRIYFLFYVILLAVKILITKEKLRMALVFHADSLLMRLFIINSNRFPLEVGGWKLEVGGWRLEVGGWNQLFIIERIHGIHIRLNNCVKRVNLAA